MDSVVERQRREHEEIDKLELATVNELLTIAFNQKTRLRQELTASALIDQIRLTAQNLLLLYADDDNIRKKDIESITTGSGTEFGDFYSRLKEVKDAHRRYPSDRLIDDSEFESLVSSARISEEAFESMFSGEEMHGKYLDLLLPYQQYINLKNVRRLDYLQYLQEFDNFEAIPMSTKLSHAYAKYLGELETYFNRYFKIAKPLFNFGAIRQAETQTFDNLWKEARVVGWTEAAQKSMTCESTYCQPCRKTFANKSVYQAHLGGKKHLRAAENAAEPTNAPFDKAEGSIIGNSNHSTAHSLALKEHLIGVCASILGTIREETRSNVERKQSRTFEEREEDIVVEESEPIDIEEESQDGRIYNPLNLPLDWDGKPIPFWLWKLHGLGVRFPCEICGNHVYMGRKAFDQHFFEWRHSNGMKALGIPNTKHFFQITRMAEAQALWDKLKQASRTETFRPEAMEEFEDHLGNVYNRKTYEDLRRQGLI